ncbi:DUF4920 domain-containing protein [Neotamlana laminarinivorans]|uniref:DUF4920 domain-containing protein n=1 Tax=Neotamlana laminarinivorans TaxID=2883124 RepID=A0A9X1I2S1_9FLAO|nr:DUF4920 domain-containing protein [Tamlana laminarinivorans]MCB4798924.1 DUF4920 domain-containing protein [Tamlana laminarinivorans]
MSYFRLLIICVLVLISCKNKSEETTKQDSQIPEVTYASFGKEIIADDAISSKSMAQHYQTMQVGDSINSKMIAKVTDVCQAKGCWMTLNLQGDEEVMVKFKDYGFFVPKDISGKDVIVNGKAFVSEISVEEQQHYAKDAGKTEEEIALITEPKKTLSFEADGVLVVQ